MNDRAKALVNVQAFLPDDKEITRILNICDMYPIDNWKMWANGKSPSIKIHQNKKLMCRYRNINFPEHKDIYSKSHPNQIAAMTKAALIIFTPDNGIFLSLCNDNKLRLARFVNVLDEWQRDYPLTLPLDDIRTLIKHESVDEYKRVPCFGSKDAIAWVTAWPPSTKLVTELNKERESICNSPVSFLISDFSNT